MYTDSPSKLAHEALGKKAIPGDINEPFQCAMCGYEFETDGHPYKPGPKFNNHADTFPSKVMCQHCKTVTTGSDFILQNKCAVYSADGVISLNKDIDLAGFVYHPPKAPFLAVYGTIKQQHLVWRTPVSQSDKLFNFRIGDYLYPVDRDQVMTIAADYKKGLAAVNDFRAAWGKAVGKKLKPLPSFFAVPTSAIRSMNDVSAFEISRGIISVLKEASTVLESQQDNELIPLAERARDNAENVISHINTSNYAEFFLALACTKNSAEEIEEYVKTRTVKGSQS